MADEDITLDGKPLQSLRVADLKAALEQRNLSKSGQKNTLMKRLKGALMLENLQKSSSSHSGLQPNSQIGEEMSQNSFIKQYLAKQQELLRQKLEREAQQDDEAEESPAVPEEDEDQSEDNESASYVSDKPHSIPSQPSMTRDERGQGDSVMGHGMMSRGPDTGPGPTLHPMESPEAPGARMRSTFHEGHKEPPAPSPPRAVASLSVRVLGQPERQGLPPAVPRTQEKEGTAPSEPGTAYPVLHMSRSAGVSAGRPAHEDNDEEDSGSDESEDDEDWGPGAGGVQRGNRAPPQPQQMPPSVPLAGPRSKRKLQPPQHIPPPQAALHTPMQLRHPTPPPSPPPDLFPLPDTPKQSPPDDQEGEGGPEAPRGARGASFPPPAMQGQDSDSSSRSSSPEPPSKRRPGPLSLLVHKMEKEKGFRAAEATSAMDLSGETSRSAASSSESQQQRLERTRLQVDREMDKERRLKEEKERERKKLQELEKEKKRLEDEQENERKRVEEEKEEKQRQKERENERKRQEEEKRRKEQMLKEELKRKETADKARVIVTLDSGSSSDSDSKSDSSSRSSKSSSSSREKPRPARQLKKADQGQEAKEETEKRCLSKREVSEPSTAAVTEVEPDSESSMAGQPPSGAEPENSEAHLEESTTPKAFAARKISLTSSKTSPGPAPTTDGGAGDSEMGTAAGRKRRWGSSTAVTAKKPSISITTDSLKSLIPDIKVNQEAVVELHPEELQLSGDEESMDTSRGDQDKGLKIRRTVTQVVPGDGQENGQTNEEEEEEVEKTEKEKPRRTSRDKRKSSVSEEASETQASVTLDGEAKKVTPSDSLVRRSISQQKSGVSITIDDPVRTTKQPSPPRGKVSNIIHVTNLVRPFTLGQLKELLNRTGSVLEEGFWIDKIKSHCIVTYSTTEEAVATRAALHGVKWPQSNPKVLSVNFCEQDELDFHKGILKPGKEMEHVGQPVVPQSRLPPLMPERDRDREHQRDRGVGVVRDLWAERQREMERRERARGEREWDRDKVREFARPGEEGPRSRSRERRRRERAKSKERKTDKKEKGDEPPAKLLDDLFLKTKAAPCIYWLPLTEEQAAQRLVDRNERQKERERKRKELQEEEKKREEEERKERLKAREKDSAVTTSGGAAGRVADGDRERDRGRERDRPGDRGREREGDKRRESSHRPTRPSAATGNGRRSRSRSNPRDRRR